MAADTRILIIDDDEPEAAGGSPAGAANDDDPVADLKSQFATLQERLKQESGRADAERAARVDAERRAAHQAVSDGAAGTENEIQTLQGRYHHALETGDSETLAKTQTELARAEARAGRLRQAEVETRPPVDPVENWIARNKLSERSADWVRRNREFVTTDRRYHQMMHAHHSAIDDGLEPDSDAYFDRVNDLVGVRKAAPAESPPVEAPQPRSEPTPSQPAVKAAAPKRRSAPPVAPVNGGSGAPPPRLGAGTSVTLTPGQLTSATDGTHVWIPGQMDLRTMKPIQPDDPRIGQPIGQVELARRIAYMKKEGRD